MNETTENQIKEYIGACREKDVLVNEDKIADDDLFLSSVEDGPAALSSGRKFLLRS